MGRLLTGKTQSLDQRGTETLSICPLLKHRSKSARRAASSASAPSRASRPSGRVRRGNPTCVTVVNRLRGVTVVMHFSSTEMVLMAPKLAPIATNAHRPIIPRAVLPVCPRRGTTICLVMSNFFVCGCEEDGGLALRHEFSRGERVTAVVR